jgi:lipoyl(octanoyl) transferase
MSGLVVWWDPPAPGPENMAADELLAAESVRTGQALVRVYGWIEPTVSLGGFQRLADAQACAALAGLPLVRRPSGGGAIVHGSDLTYAVAVPRGHPWGGDPQVLYDAFHTALAGLLLEQGIAARLHPGRDRGAGDELRFLCFDRRARGDLVIEAGDQPDGHKILGSAQRRLQAAVLQHGSLLEESLSGLAEEVRHPGLHELHPASAGRPVGRLAEAWLVRVAALTGGPLVRREESFIESHAAETAEKAARFRSPAWLGRR